MTTKPTPYWDTYVTRYDHLSSAATSHIVELLAIHAIELVNSVIVAPYDPTDATIQTVIKNAVVDQIAAWLETGDDNDLAGYAPTVSMTLGDLTVNGQPAVVSPRTLRTLRNAGLLQLWGA